jgi:chemotaxis family two-component system sensor kinase Cph1
MTTNFDSDFCGGLPIHLSNLIQPYGVLLVIDKDNHSIIQVSENTNEAFARPAEEIVGSPLASLIDDTSYNNLLEKLRGTLTDKVPALWTVNGRPYITHVHRKVHFILAEVDLHGLQQGKQGSFIDVYRELKVVMTAIEGAQTLREVCTIAVSELKRISGFDKVMIYRFDMEWNGYVMAEAMEEGMEPYLGFTFPASDIPKQARELYLKNSYRLIPDRDYTPVKLYPVVNPVTNTFIDLSDCNLRSVAAVHVEYLANMGVSASMSTRILFQDRLWGLIACHHRTPRYLTYEMCSAFEILSGIISLRVSSLINQEAHRFRDYVTVTYAQLVESVYRNQELVSSLMDETGVMKLFGAEGVAITRDGKIIKAGRTPGEGEIEELVLWLHTRDVRQVFAIESLAKEFESASSWSDRASGILVIPINFSRDQFLILFRPEKVRVITWGGNPAERIRFEPNEKNYHPRNSFKQWQEHVSGVSAPWRAEEIEAARALRSFIYEFETSVVQEQ